MSLKSIYLLQKFLHNTYNTEFSILRIKIVSMSKVKKNNEFDPQVMTYKYNSKHYVQIL